ncbi:MAG: energy-coupling factor ABC transporter ATP-binding protein [Bacillales bacterium]|nr:energy-coupling factor ABC transporter ATP-binding protein [Bacillales bacterium]
MALLEAKNLTFTYPDASEPALSDITFTVEPGEFLLLCGPSGSGKSTLLRLLKREVRPHGKVEGELFLDGQSFMEVPAKQIAQEIGMVFQDPENQIVMDRVMEELVFGLENMGYSTEDMRKRIAEMVHFFGLEELLERKTYELSGGQKQLVNLAAVLLLHPRVLLLDEPTAQLDPVAASEFMTMLRRMNEEFGLTVIMAEHRLEELFSLADRVIILEKGNKIYDAPSREVVYHLAKHRSSQMYPYLPSPARLYLEHSRKPFLENIPLTVKEGKKWVSKLKGSPVPIKQFQEDISNEKLLLVLKGIDFQYEKETRPILDQLSLSVYEGEWLAVVGANGAGKSTLLKVMAGLQKPHRGTVVFNGKKLKKPVPSEIAYLPQNPKLFFLHDTVEAELEAIIKKHQIPNGRKKMEQLLETFQLTHIKDRHPYDVSGGEMQKAALAGVMLMNPRLLLIDEPTKGLDPEAKLQLGKLLKTLNAAGITIVMVTHDIEFAAHYSTRCAMLFQGEVTITAPTKTFFQGNTFYTTVANRISRGGHVPEVLTVEEAREKWRVLE